MTFNQFVQTVEEFDEGLAPFNNGNNIDAFLFNNKWYPVRAFVNKVSNQTEINNHRSIKILVSLIPYLRIKEDVDFSDSNNRPISLTKAEKEEEQKFLIQRLNDLIYT